MQEFHHILFVSQGLTDDLEALKQALSISHHNMGELKALIVCPKFPTEMEDYREKYEAYLTNQLKASIQAARDATKITEADVPVFVEIESGSLPSARIVRHVLKNKHDLLIKEAEKNEDGKGFRALDMDLLRKCPCPVWLSRPIGKHRNEMKIAVAIDPKSTTPEGEDLSLRLLKLARSLADTCNGVLNIISCWDYELEEHLRHNVWIKIEDDELTRIVDETRIQHRTALDSIIQKSGIGGEIQTNHRRGRADIIIPQYVSEESIDILVMGTVARTGIPGFIIGNTSENIVQKLKCSLLTLKPNGFVSPVVTS